MSIAHVFGKQSNKSFPLSSKCVCAVGELYQCAISQIVTATELLQCEDTLHYFFMILAHITVVNFRCNFNVHLQKLQKSVYNNQWHTVLVFHCSEKMTGRFLSFFKMLQNLKCVGKFIDIGKKANQSITFNCCHSQFQNSDHVVQFHDFGRMKDRRTNKNAIFLCLAEWVL